MIRQMLLKRATFENNDNPQEALRPFDTDAKGSVFGEGAGVVVLEEYEHAKKRGAKIYAEIIGFGESNSLNPEYHHLEHDGKGLQIAIEKAMDETLLKADEIDLVIPNGIGIPIDDLAEATAITNALGEAVENIPVWATKGMQSATGAASGGLDLITAVKAMNASKIGASKNCDNKAPGCKLNLSTKVIETKIKHALCCGYTFGGQTAAMIIKKIDGE